MASLVPGVRPVPTLVSGDRGPENVSSERVIADMDDDLLMYMPSAAPLTVLTAKTRKKRVTTQYRFDWMEKDQYPRALELSADSVVADVTLDVVAGQGARAAANYVLLNTRTRESVLVSSIATDTLTVVRAIGGTEVDMLTGDQLVITRAVYPDGADIGTLKSIKEAPYYNYTEIIRRPFGFTGRDLQTDLYGGRDKLTETKWNAIEHAKDIEYAFLFGRRHTRTGTNNHLQTFTGGLEYWITSNRWDVSGITLTERAFVEALEETMKWGRGGYLSGSASKMLFASSRWLTEIEMWAKDRIQYRPLDKVQGLSVAEYVSSHGKVNIVRDPILDEYHPDMAFLVDMNHVRYAYLQGRDTKLLDKRQGNGVDGMEYEYLTDCGVQVEDESSHAIFTGLA